MNILLITLLIIQFGFLYKQNMDSILLKNELSSLKLDLISTKLEIQKLTLANQSNTVSDIVISEPSLLTYENGLLFFTALTICFLTVYFLGPPPAPPAAIVAEVINASNIKQLEGIKEMFIISHNAMDLSTANIINTGLTNKQEIINHINWIAINMRTSNISQSHVDTFGTTMRDTNAASIVPDIAEFASNFF